jgi:hypothetical protein
VLGHGAVRRYVAAESGRPPKIARQRPHVKGEIGPMIQF